MEKPVLQPAEILLPKEEDMQYWPVIACDQFTSQPEYWQKVASITEDNPSTFSIVFPEVYLENADPEKRIEKIHKKMNEYQKTLLTREVKGYIYVERTLPNGKVRQGIIGTVDLEEYSYEKGASCRILPSEGTIVERIPPRLEVRRNAPLECPHILMLLDDEKFSIIEPIKDNKNRLKKLYRQELMLDGGVIEGWAIEDLEQIKEIQEKLNLLNDKKEFEKKYNTNHAVFTSIAGDGNHSLATAKAYWQEVKQTLTEEEKETHPARYCLVEMENIQNTSIEVEPIHRVIFGAQEEDFMDEFEKFLAVKENKSSKKSCHKFQLIYKNKKVEKQIENSEYAIETASIDDFIEVYRKKNPQISVDYVHGEDSVYELANQGAIGIILPPIKKSDLFKGVANGGVLPKKTFSMGHANEKRYYLECRNIQK